MRQRRKRLPRQKPPRRFLRDNRRKLLVAFGSIVLLLTALIVRLTYINVSSGETYTRQVLSQLNYNSTTIPYRRGDITDRNGTILATSEKVYNLILDAYVLNNSKVKETGDCVDPTLDILEEYFGLEKSYVQDILDENPESRYIVMLQDLTYDEVEPYYSLINSEEEADQEVSQYIKGIWFEDDYIRRYPYNTLACDVIGFTVDGNVGTYGIEQYYNDVLNGVDGREYGYLTEETDLERTTIAPVNGENVQLTIDVNIQRIIEEKIWEFNEAIGSMNTAVIVMDSNNGEILGMASYPVYNLNDPRDLSNYYTDEELEEYTDEEQTVIYNELWRNFVISDTYEPGSTAKVFTVAAALDEDIVKSTDTFVCDGGERFEDGNSYTSIPCNGLHGTLDLAGALMHSCNDALMQIGAAMGKSTFIKYQSEFNFGQLTNIDLPGEASASTLLYNEDNMGPVELATNSFGQGFNATAIQVAAAFCSVVNGGSYYQPHMVSQISTESGSIVETMESELMRTTVSQETSEFIKDALLKTVGEYQSDGSLLQGSGSYAYIEGYTIAGKTGTAEKRPLTDGKCTVSFLSCAPAENPEVVVYVVIDEPQTADQGVSSLATIMSRKIYEELLPYLQIFSDSASDTDETETETETTQSETAESETGESETSESETGESETGTDESAGSSSSVTTSGSSTFAWPHLTDEEKNQVILEYLGMSNSVESRSDVRPGAETVEEMRAQEAAEAESETDESETDESQSDESQSDESESDTSEQ
ncbi:MAG TPA: penicillin-binding protein 2 [Candidatus Scybalocola faecigallinarum]|uniref:Penicillin-binding protein 2 n=1 Tax=Candidatus Scybalocola faecigallinarum TaxID=2840941 RepID=A0A9D1F5U6_9FIRM|nr:penicillin-binding protein 2 [Candidatus Scybalocola faecigallinarum]